MHRVEADAVEIELADLVAGPAQAADGRSCTACAKLSGDRVGQHHQHPHQNRSMRCSTRSRNGAAIASVAVLSP